MRHWRAVYYAHSGAWGPPQKIDEINGNSSELNTPYLDGCPIQSPDRLSLYMASNRPRYVGDTRTDADIWVAHRRNKHAPFERSAGCRFARQLDG